MLSESAFEAAIKDYEDDDDETEDEGEDVD